MNKLYAQGRNERVEGEDPRSAMISCNDGFRPVSFYLELAEKIV